MPNEPAMKRILLVEDDEELRELLHDILQSAGYEIESARNGAEALALNFVLPAHLVITDLFMPKMDGLETIIELRKQQPDLDFIAISGCGQQALNLARKFGARATLMKPFSAEKFLETVSRFIGFSPRFPKPSLA